MTEQLLNAAEKNSNIGACAAQFIDATNTYIREGRLCHMYPNNDEGHLNDAVQAYNAAGSDSGMVNAMIHDLYEMGATVPMIKRVKLTIEEIRSKDLSGVRMLLWAATLVDKVEALLEASTLVGSPAYKDVLKTLLTLDDLDASFLESQPADLKAWLYEVFILDNTVPTSEAFAIMMEYRDRVMHLCV
jgi:hypothetical protein